MVFFTCSHCGESVKKPSVSKHYQTKCRKKDPLLTCVDCLKDFKGNEYEAHTKCLTEEEKYSAKGHVPKPSKNKGQRKQQTWQESLQTVLKKPTLKPDERDLIRAISKYENVPRKKAKFNNFLNNAFKQYAGKTDLIDRVWVEMEMVFKEMTAIAAEGNKAQERDLKPAPKSSGKTEENSVKKEKKRKRQADEDKATENNADSGKKDEKQKKKKQKQNEEKPAEGNDGMLIDEETEGKEEKKSRKRKADEDSQTEQTNSVADEAEPGKKKKKKKNDKQGGENQVTEAPEKKGEESGKAKKKDKKPKTGNAEGKPETAGGAPAAKGGAGGGDTNAVKKEKKPKKSENKENCEQKPAAKNAKPESQGDAEKAPKKKKLKAAAGAPAAAEANGDEKQEQQFDWKATILQVLGSEGKNNRIQLQKLQKKVLKLHCQVLNCENSEKKEKRFLKKLKEIPDVVMDKEFVVLKS